MNEEKIDALQNQFHDALNEVLADNKPAIDKAKEVLAHALAEIQAFLDVNPNEAGERVVNANPAEYAHPPLAV